MKSMTADFCAVCARERDVFFGALRDAGSSSGPTTEACPERYRGDGICDTCLDDDPDCGGGGGGDDGDTCNLLEKAICALPFTDCDCADGGGGDGCGDGQCDGDETDANCGEDCGCAAVDDCEAVAPSGCYCDDSCAGAGDCCADIEVCQ